MEMKPLGLSEQLRTIRGVDNIFPKQGPVTSPDSAQGKDKPGFADFLVKQITEANSLGVEAEDAIKRSLEGKELNPHSTLIAVQKAGIALTLLMGVKTRLERAYQELIKTPL